MTPTPTASTVRAARHVLIVVENLPVPFDRRVWSEATTLREAGYDVSVICPGASGTSAEREVLDGITIYRHPLREAVGGAPGYVREYLQALWWETRLAWRVWREHRFDAIHLCNPPDLLFLVALPFKALGVRVVFDHHDLNPELYVVKFGTRGLAHGLLLLAERLTFATADRVIATNESYASIARGRGRKPEESVSIVRSAPDLRRFVRRPRAPNDGEGQRLMTIGYVGVMAAQDGVDLLIRALHELVVVQRRRGLQAVCIGDGPERTALEHLASTLGVAGAIRFTGYLTGDALLSAMSGFDVGVCPDPKNDYNDKCTMNKTLEYMALGIPVVQFDLVEGRRSAGEAAVYAGRDNDPRALADAIARLLDDPSLAERIAGEGHERMVSALEWRHQAPRLLDSYDRLWR